MAFFVHLNANLNLRIMKKIFWIACAIIGAIFLGACSPVFDNQGCIYSSVINYKQFNDNGIYVTKSYDVDFAYQPVCSLMVGMYKGVPVDIKHYTVKGKNRVNRIDKYKVYNIYDMIDTVCVKVKKYNGDAIIGMSIIQDGYYSFLTGTVVKRK